MGYKKNNELEKKDIIYIKKDNGELAIFEGVTLFKIDNSDYNYIIYRNIEQTDYYIAKYKGEKIVDLDTELTEKEIKIGEKILEGIM